MEVINARGRREGGQMLVLFVLLLGVLMGFVAMSIDVGMTFQERRSQQNAADAAALAAVAELPDSPTAAVAAAYDWANRNGYSSADGATVTVTTPYQGNPGVVEVIIEEDEPFIFALALGLDSIGVHARAVASIDQGTIGKTAAILLLNEHDCGAFKMVGTNDLTITNNGAIVVNSDCDSEQNGAIDKGGSSVATIEGGIFYYEEGNWTMSGSGALNPEPEPIPSRTSDPLGNLAPPDPFAIATSPDSGGTAADPETLNVSTGTHTLHPGVYWGGLQLQADEVVLLPGTYIMAGGGLAIGGSGLVTGDEVFFYNTYDPENLSSNADGQCGSIDLRGTATYTLTAPTSGAYKDVLFWQDEACTDSVKVAGSGEGGGGGSGIFYAPSAELELVGGGSLGALQIIADTITIMGGSDIDVTFFPYVDIPVPGHGPMLVE